MDDLQLHMNQSQQIHEENARQFDVFMNNSQQQAHHHHNKREANEAKIEQLEREFQEWMEYIRNKKLD